MALKKLKEFSFGITGDYWTITVSNVSWITKTAHWEIACFRSESHYRAGEQFIPESVIALDFNEDYFPFVKGGNNHAIAYEEFKKSRPIEDEITGEIIETNYLVDAIDV